MRSSLALPVAFALLATVNLVLVGDAVRNRSGQPDTVITLDERELGLVDAQPEEAGASLRWQYQSALPLGADRRQPLGPDTLKAIGFDLSVRPGERGAPLFFARSLPRRALVVFEVGGRTWEAAVAEWQTRAAPMGGRPGEVIAGPAGDHWRSTVARAPGRASRLLLVDAGTDLDGLRARYPDRRRHLILPAVVALSLERLNAASGPMVSGTVREILPRVVAVGGELRRSMRQSGGATRLDASEWQPGQPGTASLVRLAHEPRYQVEIAVGRELRPWIVRTAR